MGIWFEQFLKADITHLRKHKDALPCRAVRTHEGCDFIAFEDEGMYVWLEEPDVAIHDTSTLCQALSCPVLIMFGHTVSEGFEFFFFEEGRLRRSFCFDGTCWQTQGEPLVPLENTLITRYLGSAPFEEHLGIEGEDILDEEMCLDEDRVKALISKVDRDVFEHHILQDGAMIPRISEDEVFEVLGVQGLTWGGGDEVVLKERKGLRKLLFGS